MNDTGWHDNSRIRCYGNSGRTVFLLHGGPAAYGDLGDMASNLADSFHVIEPWQRPSSDIPLSVRIHVDDLHDLIEWKCPDTPPAIVGHSWGAMLALIYASEYPDQCGPVALVGCGTFDIESRAKMKQILDERTDYPMRIELDRIDRDLDDYGNKLVEKYKITGKLQQYEHIESVNPSHDAPFDKNAHEETWSDMVRLQEEGIYPQRFVSIKSPVIMLHGTYDPHPGRMIYTNLQQFIPNLEYREWEKCGHYPWREKFARDEFLAYLKRWLDMKNSD